MPAAMLVVGCMYKMNAGGSPAAAVKGFGALFVILPVLLVDAHNSDTRLFQLLPPNDTEQPHRLLKMQKDIMTAVQAGVIDAAGALQLVEDVAALRQSLASGAAAESWQQHKPPAAAPRREACQQNTGAQAGKPGAEHIDDPGACAAATKGTNPAGGAATAAQGQSKHIPSRGILIVAGGRHQFRNAFILLQLLRHRSIGCTLPVELVYYGALELDAAVAAALTQHAAATGTSLRILDGNSMPAPSSNAGVSLGPHRQQPGKITGFKAKVHALVWVTSFDQVRVTVCVCMIAC